MSVAIVKTGCSIGAIIVVAAILQTTTAMDAILLFAAAGVVPGTDIKLTPNATLWVLGGVVAASVLLIFSMDLFRLARSLFRIRRAKPTTAPAALLAEVALPQPAATKTPVLKPEPPKPVVIIKIPAKPGYISRAAHATRTALRNFVVLAAVLVAVETSLVRRAVINRTLYVLGVIRLYIVHAWQWLKPRLVQAQRYMSAKLNQHQDITFIIDFLRAVSKGTSKWWGEARARFLRYMAKIGY